ncbi:hypothetical protein NMG60_11026078 [Bertholletia excelsa]
MNIDVVGVKAADSEERYSCETRNSQEDCCTTGTRLPESSRLLQRSRSHGLGERSKRKRRRARQEKYDVIQEVPSGNSMQELSTTTSLGSESLSTVDEISGQEDKYEIVLAMKELASRGMAAEVVEEIEFLKLVSSGDHSSTLRVASSHLGPLVAQDPALLKPLKETLLALLRPSQDALGGGLPFHALAASLQVAIGRRLGIEEPLLMKIVGATLHTHNEWFELQMCKDHFEGLLRIDSLKEVSGPLLIDAASKSQVDSSTQGSSQVTICSSGIPSITKSRCHPFPCSVQWKC